MDDLKIINKVSGKPLQKKPQSIPPNMTAAEYLYDARIDDGRLYYDKRWYVLLSATSFFNITFRLQLRSSQKWHSQKALCPLIGTDLIFVWDFNCSLLGIMRADPNGGNCAHSETAYV